MNPLNNTLGKQLDADREPAEVVAPVSTMEAGAEPAPPAAEPVPSAAAPEAPNTSSSPAEAGGAPLLAVAAEAAKATIGGDDVTQTWEERSRERKHELQALREKEKATLGALQRRGAKERLAYLMKQTGQLAHLPTLLPLPLPLPLPLALTRHARALSSTHRGARRELAAARAATTSAATVSAAAAGAACASGASLF